MRQLSIDLFLETLNYVEDQEKRKMQEEVCRSLVLLYLHLHDEEESVAKVGIAFMCDAAPVLPSKHRGTAAHGSVIPCCCILPAEGLWEMRAPLLFGLRCHLSCSAGLPESLPRCRTVPALEAAGAPGRGGTVLADRRVHGMHIPTSQVRVRSALR